MDRHGTKSHHANRSHGKDNRDKRAKLNAFTIDPLQSVTVIGKDSKPVQHTPSQDREVDSHSGSGQFKRAWKRAFFGLDRNTGKKLFHLIWASLIGSFLIPKFRPEWKAYAKWDPKKHFLRSQHKVSKRRARLYSSSFRKRKNVPWYRSKKTTTTRYAAEPTPRYVEHDHSMCKTVRINVSGEIFEPQLRTLQRFPNTLLGNPDRMIQFYDPVRDEYFFDRHRTCFEAIIYYYTTGGLLRRPQHASLDILLEEVKFFDLGDEIVARLSTLEPDEILPDNLLKRKLWLFLEHPQSSFQAQIFAYLSILAVLLSTIQFCIETLPMFNEYSDILDLKDPFFFVETVCVLFFVFEYIMRLFTSPSLVQFIRGFSNFVDLIAVVPYFINILQTFESSGGGQIARSKTVWLTVLRTIRLVRVFRIFKLSRHNKGLKILGKTLKASRASLVLLVFFLSMGVVIFSSVMYVVESPNPDTPFTSIPGGFWFSLVTMTTLGVGDFVPTTVLGKIVGSLCAITGVLTISLPVPLIVSHFTMFYNSAEMSNPKLNSSSKNFEFSHVEHCPYYPGWYAKDGSVINGNDPVRSPTSTANNSPAARKHELAHRVGDLQPDDSDSDFDKLKME